MTIKGSIELNIVKVNGIDVKKNMVGSIAVKKSIQKLLDKICIEQIKFFKKQKIEATMTARLV
jgi:hypothetical protein